MLSKITNSLAMIFVGFFLGGMAGFFFFSGTQFIRYFLFYSLLLIIPILLYKIIRTIKNLTFINFVSSIFSTIFTWYIFCCAIGLIWLFVSEGGEFDDLDTIIFVIFLIFSILITMFLLPIRMVWFDTKLGLAVDKFLTELKFLVGMKK